MDTRCKFNYITGVTVRNIIGALLLAGAIALPFVIYFWNMTP